MAVENAGVRDDGRRDAMMVDEGSRALPGKARLLSLLWGALISSMGYADFLLRGGRGGLAAYSFDVVREAPPFFTPVVLAIHGSQLGILILLISQIGVDLRQSARFAALGGIMSVLILIGLLVLGEFRPLGVGLVAIFFIAVCVLASALRDPTNGVIRDILVGFAIANAGLLLIVIHDANYSYGRLMGRSGPNFWGMMSVATIMSAVAIRIIPLRLLVIAIGATTLVLVQARGSMVAAAIGLGVTMTIVFSKLSSGRRIWMVLGGGATFLIGLVLSSDIILNRLLLVSDKGRGLESGGTGRLGAWVQTLALVEEHPWLGVGFRQHETYLTAASSAHNAYLAMMGDLGLPGLFFYLWLMIGGAVIAIGKAYRSTDNARLSVVGLVIGFLCVGMTERVAINTGNPYSVLMILVMAWTWRNDGPSHLSRLPSS